MKSGEDADVEVIFDSEKRKESTVPSARKKNERKEDDNIEMGVKTTKEISKTQGSKVTPEKKGKGSRRITILETAELLENETTDASSPDEKEGTTKSESQDEYEIKDGSRKKKKTEKSERKGKSTLDTGDDPLDESGRKPKNTKNKSKLNKSLINEERLGNSGVKATAEVNKKASKDTPEKKAKGQRRITIVETKDQQLQNEATDSSSSYAKAQSENEDEYDIKGGTNKKQKNEKSGRKGKSSVDSGDDSLEESRRKSTYPKSKSKINKSTNEVRHKISDFEVMQNKAMCTEIAEEYWDNCWDIIIERFNTIHSPVIVLLQLRDAWMKIAEMQWMDGYHLDDEILPVKYFERDPPPLPLAFDSWSRGAIEALPKTRRESVLDPFIHDGPNSLFTQESANFVSDDLLKSNVPTAQISIIDTGKSNLANKKRSIGALKVSSFDNLNVHSGMERTKSILRNRKISDSYMDGVFDELNSEVRLKIFPNYTSDEQSYSEIRLEDSFETLLPAVNELRSSSTETQQQNKHVGGNTKPWSPSQCGARVGSGTGVFHLPKETTEEAVEKWKEQHDNKPKDISPVSDNNLSLNVSFGKDHENVEVNDENKVINKEANKVEREDGSNNDSLSKSRVSDFSDVVVEPELKEESSVLNNNMIFPRSSMEANASINTSSQIVDILTPKEALNLAKTDIMNRKSSENIYHMFGLRDPDLQSAATFGNVKVFQHDLQTMYRGNDNKTVLSDDIKDKGDDLRTPKDMKKSVSFHQAVQIKWPQEKEKSIQPNHPGKLEGLQKAIQEKKAQSLKKNVSTNSTPSAGFKRQNDVGNRPVSRPGMPGIKQVSILDVKELAIRKQRERFRQNLMLLSARNATKNDSQ